MLTTTIREETSACLDRWAASACPQTVLGCSSRMWEAACREVPANHLSLKRNVNRNQHFGCRKGTETVIHQSYMYIEIYHIFNDAITQVTSVHITRVCLNIYTYTPYILICVRTSRVCKCQHYKHVLPCLNVRKHGLTAL